MATSTLNELKSAGVDMLITFLYYEDLPAACRFYEEIIGLDLVLDQGFAKVYQVSGGGHIGVVDEAQGMHRAHPAKPVQICLRVPDVDAWYAYLREQDVSNLSEIRDSARVGIRLFTLDDPEGYQIEIHSTLR